MNKATFIITTPGWIFRRLNIALILFGLLLSSCASTPNDIDGKQSADEPSSVQNEVATEDENNSDKFESFNRAIFSFNMTADRWLVRPVAKGYDTLLPGPVQAGVGNFFDNLGEVSNIINDGLQWKWGQAAKDSGRLVVNSTLGLLGLFDVASTVGMDKSDGESLNQTLAVWGVPSGPYLVLPFLGPSTVRGTSLMPAEWKLDPTSYIDHFETKMGAKLLERLHARAELLATDELASGDYYVFVREAYLQRMDYLEKDGKIEDSFGDSFGDDEYDF